VQNLANGTACSDNDKCTGTDGADSCLNGACASGAPKSCPVTDAQCQAGTCNPGTGNCSVQDKQNGTLCTDNDTCTGINGDDACTDGACMPGAAKDCSTAEGISCTVDTCDPADGTCVHTPSNAACADAFSCTVDTCSAAADAGTSGCVFTPDGALCAPPTCQSVVACSATSGCLFLDEADGTPCAYTAGDASSGMCLGAGATPAGTGQATCVRAFPYSPSNFSTGDSTSWPATTTVLRIPSGCTVTFNTFTPPLNATGTVTATGAACTIPPGMMPAYINQPGPPSVPSTVLAVTGLVIEPGGELKITGTDRPALVAVWGDADLQGDGSSTGGINASAASATSGPGANITGACPNTLDGAASATNLDGANGGAGGPNATLGGAGGDGEGGSATGTAAAGATGFNASLVPLRGGCPGGKGGGVASCTLNTQCASNSCVGGMCQPQASGGGGGGAVQLSVAGKLTVAGKVAAAGGGGGPGKLSQPAGANCTSNNTCSGHGGGGGGAGGSVLLEAGSLTLKATARLAVNGGGGGGGAKGAALSAANAAEGTSGAAGSTVATTAAAGGTGGDPSTNNGGGNGGAGADGATTNAGSAGAADLGGGNQNAAGGGGGGGLGRIRINVHGTTCREASTVSNLSTGASPNVGNTAGFSYAESGVAVSMPSALAAGQSCP